MKHSLTRILAVRKNYSKLYHGVSTAEALPIARDWLETCMSQHETCKPVSADWLPSRLLNVTDARIRIVLSSEVQSRERYITLSHCWGDADFLKLSRNTYNDLRQGIEPSILPLSFQHAVETTRFFKVKYLWIDALCIMQDDDDKSDWTREALLMHKIYTRSYLNLFASASVDSRGGLYTSRDLKEFLPTFITLSRGNLWNPDSSTEYILVDMGIIHHDFGAAPVHKRG